jgi:transcriptional regulator with XRE-family HTH domain
MLLKALAEEEMSTGLKQTDIARAIGVHRSVINRELRGKKDITLGRSAELAWAMGRKISFDLPKQVFSAGANHLSNFVSTAGTSAGAGNPPSHPVQPGTNNITKVAA